jgi:uncharacterized protein YjbI with pentapeptide repeats
MSWTGFRDKTLWDWLQLLLVPAGLAVAAFLLNNWATDRDRQREEERADRASDAALDSRREEDLRNYLSQMSDLMLDDRLLRSRPEADVRTVARTLTLTVVRRLDGERKGVVVRFLYEADALKLDDRKVDLEDADLHGMKLPGAELYVANLSGVDLRRADLTDAGLSGTSFAGSNLRRARLFDAELGSADLRGACLTRTQLRDTNLYAAELDEAEGVATDLRSANLLQASFREAQLARPRLAGADPAEAEVPWKDPRLSRAEVKSLCASILR